jgi:hypothetical protein
VLGDKRLYTVDGYGSELGTRFIEQAGRSYIIFNAFIFGSTRLRTEDCSMKALSIKQPWANMIATGVKTIETRTWCTEYRGPLLIVSSKTPRIEPAGYAIAVGKLIDCRPMKKEDEEDAGCRIYPNAYAWVLTNIKKIKPFPVRGKLGLYDVDFVVEKSPLIP